MYNVREVANNITWVGVNDHRIQRFENMFPLANGISYNSYLITGQKTCVMDTVDQSTAARYFANIHQVLQGRALDYLVVQHMEPDHCGSIEQLLLLHPETKLVGNSKTFTLFEQFYNDRHKDRYHLVSEGDALDLGGACLRFIMAPMVHWPEVMVSYEEKSGCLFSADAFGAFNAIQGNLFADEVNLESEWLSESRRYYTNIVGRHGLPVQRLFKKLSGLDIKYLCSLHGLVYRNADDIAFIMDKYAHWASYRPEETGVVIAYASMYGNTEEAVEHLAILLAERGVRAIKTFDISQTHPSFIISEVFRYSHLVLAGINYNTELYFGMDAFLRELLACNIRSRKIAKICNISWGGRAEAIMDEILSQAHDMTTVGETFRLRSAMKLNQNSELTALADALAESLRETEQTNRQA